MGRGEGFDVLTEPGRSDSSASVCRVVRLRSVERHFAQAVVGSAVVSRHAQASSIPAVTRVPTGQKIAQSREVAVEDGVFLRVRERLRDGEAEFGLDCDQAVLARVLVDLHVDHELDRIGRALVSGQRRLAELRGVVFDGSRTDVRGEPADTVRHPELPARRDHDLAEQARDGSRREHVALERA